MRGLIAALCVAAAFALALQGAGGTAFRGVLWKVVRTCVANSRLTGSPFPCLEVNLAGGMARGYIVLRSPVGEPDLILSPTRRSIGVEDPSLREPGAPNYFADAWKAQSYLGARRRGPLAHGDIGLAVNSRVSRTQDQLHIHIGCLTRDADRTVRALAPELDDHEWRPIAGRIHGLRFWGRLIDQDTLEGVNPFQLAALAGAAKGDDGSDLMIVAAGATLGHGREGFVLLASRDDPNAVTPKYTAENFLDPRCL